MLHVIKLNAYIWSGVMRVNIRQVKPCLDLMGRTSRQAARITLTGVRTGSVMSNRTSQLSREGNSRVSCLLADKRV